MSKRRIARVELARLLEIDEGFIAELEAHEIVTVGEDGRFDVTALERVRVCWTMQRSFGVNMPGLEVALDLLERWQDERARAFALLEELRRERED